MTSSPQRLLDRGSVSLELVVVAPAFLLILVGVIFAGRVAIASNAVQVAAADAARTASLARTATSAQAEAQDTARTSLSSQGLQCQTTDIAIDTSGFAVPVGTAAQVRATVSCTVNLADLAAPGLPGTKVVTASVVSPLDTYRGRSA